MKRFSQFNFSRLENTVFLVYSECKSRIWITTFTDNGYEEKILCETYSFDVIKEDQEIMQILCYADQLHLFMDNGDYYLFKMLSDSKCITENFICNTSSWQNIEIVSNNFLSFVKESSLYMYDIESRCESQLSSNNPEGVFDGIPEYVIQEEFSRFNGYWWKSKGLMNDNLLLYIKVDCREVEKHYIPISESMIEQIYYPRAGTKNAKSYINVIDTERNFYIRDLDICGTYPWIEYIVLGGWIKKTNICWFLVFDRCQTRMALLMVFVQNNVSISCAIEEICSPDNWINSPGSLIYFFNQYKWIWPSERSGFLHLYLHEINGISIPLTSGEWCVQEDSFVFVNECFNLIFFMGMRDSHLESHLYCKEISRDAPLHRMTKTGFSHDVILFDYQKNTFLAVDFYSSIESFDVIDVLLIVWKHKDCTPNVYTQYRICPLIQRNIFPGNCLDITSYSCDNTIHLTNTFQEFQELMFSINLDNTDRTKLYGRLFIPRNVPNNYPLLLNIYNGPKIQKITNSSMYFEQNHELILSACRNGYGILSVDGRGSSRRGVKFESPIKRNFGYYELKDQVFVIENLYQFLLQNRPELVFNKNCVSLIGWSYGGFLSIRALIDYPNIFSKAIAGSPVVDWMDYDTAYTERYLGIPLSGSIDSTYKKCSLLDKLHLIKQGRLLVVHGVADSNVFVTHSAHLRKYAYVYTYQGEGHGLRIRENIIHFNSLILKFLQE